jgi:SagB-type dehydrogenase family enzyme
MNNRDLQATRQYHNGTKHPRGYLLNPSHRFDPASQPLLFKVYTDLESIPLPLNTSPAGVAALSAISSNIAPTTEEQIPDIDTLARTLYFSAGLTKRLKFKWGEMAFRAAACTGALYHIELYVVCGDLPGLEGGVYHFDPSEFVLKRLRRGDYRRVLVEASGHEPGIVRAPAVFVYTDVFWRNACKYQAREYRHAFWDSGTVLAHTLAMASAHDLPAQIVAGFDDASVNRLLDLDTQREVALVLVPVGHTPNQEASLAPEVRPLSLKTMPISSYEIEFPAILEMHAASSLAGAEHVIAWRGKPPAVEMPASAGRLVALQPYTETEMPQDSIEAVIKRRGSTRQFSRESVNFRQLSTILDRALPGVPADFLEPTGATLNSAYLIVNAVEGLEPGTYVFFRERQALELLKAGDFRGEAGYLALNQDLAADASVNIFFLADLEPVLSRFGNRGYRAAQLDASIQAGRVYLATDAQQMGATGLTFFDDVVTNFFSPHAQGKSVMFLMALGKRARQSRA